MLSALLLAVAAATIPPTYFVGDWQCKIASPAGERTWIYKNSLGLGERWIHMHIEGPSRVPGKQYMGEVYVGFNDLSRKYARITVNNFGGYWISESDGWRGESWTWTDVTSEDNEWGITEITRISPDHYRSIEKTRSGKGGEPVTRSRMDCERMQ
jgi:hypothetical protein